MSMWTCGESVDNFCGKVEKVIHRLRKCGRNVDNFCGKVESYFLSDKRSVI